METTTNNLALAIKAVDIGFSAPAAFAAAPAPDVSARYSFLPSSEVVRFLGEKGWLPSKAQQVQSRNPSLAPFKRHLVCFRNPAMLGDDENIPEIVMINSHDRSSSLSFYFGIFRLVCSNGLVVARASFGAMRFVHNGYAYQEIEHILESFVPQSEKIYQRIEIAKKIELPQGDRLRFAAQAAQLRWGEKEINSEALLKPRRREDEGSDLWRTFNVVQENIIKGGCYAYAQGRSRAIKSIARDVSINVAFWQMVEKSINDHN